MAIVKNCFEKNTKEEQHGSSGCCDVLPRFSFRNEGPFAQVVGSATASRPRLSALYRIACAEESHLLQVVPP